MDTTPTQHSHGRERFPEWFGIASDISGELGSIRAPQTNRDQLRRRDWRMRTGTSPSAHVSAKIRINTEIIPGSAHACFERAEMVEKQQKSNFLSNL